jgi:phage shock protein PspC (stress-responsive transcriptional regulator)
MQEIGGGHRLERSSDRVLGGVCAGLAHRFAVEPLLVRLAFVVLTLASGAGVVLYALLWVLMPEEGEPPREGDLLRAGLRAVEADLTELRDGAGGRLPAGHFGAPASRIDSALTVSASSGTAVSSRRARSTSCAARAA